ncbi:hypothetical protein Hamer_G013454 [Homarus americanus]|uniref:Uncharacterized protein n=1 Tax=Homarus americanus TaxID=6706 RepID=A0A8J5KG63_HOMAM|nr:hypothetical protein Hamer_G013454 [Homarus americanus]
MGWCVCYFPGELQGVWETQVTSGQDSRPPITYQEITIHTDIIVQWGSCHARIDNYIILTDRTGSTVCFRCIQMDVVSPQVMQVWSTGMQTCYLSEEAALRTCPASADVASRRAVQTMLYNQDGVGGEGGRDGGVSLQRHYTFTYRRGPASNGVAAGSCDQPTSQFSNCPYGFAYNVIYRDCSFPAPQPRGLQCLGSWVGEDRKDYLAVWDSSVKEDDVAVPRYKCGVLQMFLEEAGTGRVLLSFSEDSTCTNNLNSPTDGYENYVLMSVRPATATRRQRLHLHLPRDPLRPLAPHLYRRASCVKDLLDGERFIVYARTHCGDWNYNCLWLKRRSANVLEFMLGLYPRENFDVSLCDVGKFGDMTSWITQGKSLLEEPTTCPIVGNYAGELPDAPGYCAQLYSDCETPQLMYYTVGDCRNTSNVYEHEDLPGPTSEAGPWLPPEQKVSTGAVLTIADDEGGRGRRQVNGGQFRVANARTTTISWLWGTTPDTTTSTTTSTTTTTTTTRSPSSQRSPWTHLPLPRPPPAHSESTSERNYDRFQPDPYSEFRSQPEPPRRGGYNPVDFWPSNPSRPQYPPENAAPELSVAPPQPPRDPSPTSDNSEVAGSGVPGRATWVPGAPPGFLSASTHQPHVSEPRNPVGDNRHPTPPAPHNPSYNYSPDVGTGRQPLEQSIHSQQPIKQGMQSKDESEYAWDNRLKHPPGYWFTAGPQDNVSASVNAKPDLPDRGVGWEPSEESGQSMTDSRDVHVGGGSGSGEVPSSVASWPGSDGRQDGNRSFTRSSALSDLGGPRDVTTSFPSGWKPSLGPSFSTSSSPVFSSRDESDRTNNRQPISGRPDTDDEQQVRDSSFSHRKFNRTTNRQPGGRGFWSSSTQTDRNQSPWDSGSNPDSKRLSDEHSYTSSTKEPPVFVDRPIDRPRDTLNFHPVDPDQHSSVNRDFYRTTEDSTWRRNQDRTPSGSEVDDIPLYRDRGAGKSPGRDAGSHWISETIDTVPAHVNRPGKLGYQSSIGEPGRVPGSGSTAAAPARGIPAHSRRVTAPILPAEREYQCLGQWEEEGRLYALTYRRDIRIYECFVGVIKPQGVVFIKEAGSHCSRGIRPEVLGMKLHRKEKQQQQSSASYQTSMASYHPILEAYHSHHHADHVADFLSIEYINNTHGNNIHDDNTELGVEELTHETVGNSRNGFRSYRLDLHENVTSTEMSMINEHSTMTINYGDGESLIHDSHIAERQNTAQDCGDLSETESRNITEFVQLSNCSGNWLPHYNTTVERTGSANTTEVDSKDTDAHISTTEYQKDPLTTVKPFLVTLPALVWQPLGRPSHRGSGSATLLTPSLVLIFTITAALIASTVRTV